jgi:hypothetical protein
LIASSETGAAGAGPACVRIAILLFCLFLAIYIGFRSNDHYFDSVDYALIVESDGERLFWPKHILQHACVKLIHQAQLVFGSGGRALTTAQIVNAFAGAAAVACFFALLARTTGDAWLAGCTAVLLGFSAAVARHAVEGEVYALPLFFLCLALLAATRKRSRMAAALVGAAQAASVLMHQGYVCFVPALGVYLVLRGGWRVLWPWAAALVLPTVAVYSAVFSLTGLPIAALPPWLKPETPWMPFGPRSLFGTLTSLLHALSPSESLDFSAVWLPAPIAIVAVLAVGWRPAWLRFRHELILCLLSIGTYLLVLARQGPTFQYFPPLNVMILWLAALCLRAAARGRLSRGVLGVSAALFAVFSVALTLIPAHTRNDSLDRADFVRRAVGPADSILILGAGSSTNDPVYFPYFAGRRAISLWRLECCSDPSRPLAEKLDDEIDATLLAGGRVFLFDGRIATEERLPTPLGGWFTIGGHALRRHLELRYRTTDRGTYSGRGYSERLLELEKLSCGPEPHFKTVGGVCLPSCGVLASRLGASQSPFACCPRGCGPSARLLGPAWDCEACCGGAAPLCR